MIDQKKDKYKITKNYIKKQSIQHLQLPF